MIRAMLSMVVRPGQEDEFQKIWLASARQIALGHPANQGQSLALDANGPRKFVISSDWASREALEAFESSAARRALSEALEPLRESAAKSVLEIVATV